MDFGFSIGNKTQKIIKGFLKTKQKVIRFNINFPVIGYQISTLGI